MARRIKRIGRNDYFNTDITIAKNAKKRKSKRLARNDYIDVNSFATNPNSISSIPVGMWVAVSGRALKGPNQGFLGPYTSKSEAMASALRIYGFGQTIYAGKVTKNANGSKVVKIKPLRDPKSALNPCHGKSCRRAKNDYFNTDANVVKNPMSGVNLDSMDLSDLKKLYRNFGKLHSPKFNKSAEMLFPSKPRGYINATYEIKRMARLLIKSKMFRVKGYIDRAMYYEKQADELYNQLPDFAKTW